MHSLFAIEQHAGGAAGANSAGECRAGEQAELVDKSSADESQRVKRAIATGTYQAFGLRHASGFHVDKLQCRGGGAASVAHGKLRCAAAARIPLAHTTADLPVSWSTYPRITDSSSAESRKRAT